ncbi:hypothetical protein [Hymenobacter sp. HDW8]|uniref:hypothetical protein n=1 Tax=Hymenobacter sp. HDW8 TaxID=2714932 RepID=UPI00140A7546|nr:hypothetical protein [Hymenobacter sp. HDW8]QIL77085.1 hypothetical protein G7064_15445 [Hymenobacter sp. HDW8]
MKTKFLCAALLLSASAYAQTAPAPATPPAATGSPAAPPKAATPAPINPVPTPQNTERSTLDQSASPTAPAQERVRKRQTVMDGQASPSVETTTNRRTKRINEKKRPAADTQNGTPPTR